MELQQLKLPNLCFECGCEVYIKDDINLSPEENKIFMKETIYGCPKCGACYVVTHGRRNDAESN